MSWWKKAKTLLDDGSLMDSLEIHIAVAVQGQPIEHVLRDLEKSTGYVRSEWSEQACKKALSHSSWKVRALAVGHATFSLNEREFQAALKEKNWFPQLVFLSRPDVVLSAEQVLALEGSEKREGVVTKILDERRSEWRAQEDATRLKARFGFEQPKAVHNHQYTAL